MPAMAAGTCRRKQRNVAVATSGTEACRLQFLPARTMLGLSSIASRYLFEQSMEHRVKDIPGDLLAALDRM